MVSATIILIGVVVLLLVLNVVVSRVPKKDQKVKVSFIPPSNPALMDSSVPVDFMGQLNAHVHATNVKITQLFSRMEDLEKRVFDLEQNFAPAKEEAWIETVPVRNKKK